MSVTTDTTSAGTSTGLPAWMPGGRVEAEHEPVFHQLVQELDLLTRGAGPA